MDTLNSEVFPISENTTNSFEDLFYELFQPENLRHSWSWTIFFIVIYSIIFALGVVGNFIVIFVFCRRRQMRSVTNMFIVNLAVADLLVILFCVPVTLVSNIFVPWILGTFICKGAAYIQGISVFASAYTLAAISVERCKGIYRFKPVMNNLTKLQALLIIAAIWMTAFVTLLPWPIVFEVVPIPENGTTLFCIESWSDEFMGGMYFLFGNLMCCYAIPGIIISITNSQVCWRVSSRKIPVGSASPIYVKNHHRRVKSGVKKMLSLVTFTFLLSWLPLYVVMCRVKFTSIETMIEIELDILNVLIPIVQLLGISNSCVNPVLYAYMNSRFREMCSSVFDVPTCSNLSCYERYRRTNSQRSLLLASKRLRNNNVLVCRNNEAQQSSSTNNISISHRSEQYPCRDETLGLGSFCDKERYESFQAHVAAYVWVRREIRLLKLSRETSV